MKKEKSKVKNAKKNQKLESNSDKQIYEGKTQQLSLFESDGMELFSLTETVPVVEKELDSNKNVSEADAKTGLQKTTGTLEKAATEESSEFKEKDALTKEKPKKVREHKEKVPKEKLSKFDKRRLKQKKQEALLNLRGIPKYYATFLVETLYIFAIEVLFKLLFGNLAWDWTLLRILMSSSFLSLIVTLVVNNLPLKLRRGLLIAFNFLITFYAWLQLGFMNFIGAFMSLGNAEQGTKIGEYVFEFLSAYPPVLHTMFIPFILTILYFVFERNITRDGFDKKIKFSSLIQDTAILVFAGLLGFMFYVTLEVDFMQNKFQTVTNKELIKYPSNPAYAIKNFGTTIYFVLDIKGTIFGGEETRTPSAPSVDDEPDISDNSREIDDEAWENLIKLESDATYRTLNNYFINKPIADKNEYTGMFEGKNLVMIMLESVGTAVFSEEYKEYFPTLYKLYNEGITGVNNYSPRNNCATGESEMTSEISMYSIETTCTVNSYKDNEYRQALLHMLRGEGYYTSSYHDYTDLYYSRSTYTYNMGAMRYYGIDELGVSYEQPYNEWPSDLEFFEKAVPKFVNQEKFASYLVTVTAHTPYIFASKMGNQYVELFSDLDLPLQTKRYLSKVKEDDLALEHLLDSLEEAGKLEDTVIVLFGDHYPYALGDKYQDLADWDTSVNHEVDRTPFIIYNSETEPQKIEKYMTPLDYTPTLLNLFGVDYDPRYYFGHDVYSDYMDYVVFPDHSWQSPYGYYSAPKGEFFPMEGERVLTDEEIIAINTEITDMRNMSNLAIKKNYFKYLFDYFDDYKRLAEEKKREEETETKTKKKDTEED